MKKYLKLAAMTFCAALILAVSTGRVFARLTGTEPGTDVMCVGVSGAEVCVDVSGNFLPTTNNDTTLGTSALAWSAVYAYDLVLSDDLTVADDLTVTGDLQKTATTQTLAAGGTIDIAGACGGLISLSVTANRTTDTTNTFTAPAAANSGCRLTIVNAGGGTITLDDNALFNIIANMVLETGDTVEVISNGSAWALIQSQDNS